MSCAQILYLTELEQWSPHAVYQATRLFVSNLNAKLVRHLLRPRTVAGLRPRDRARLQSSLDSLPCWLMRAVFRLTI